MSDIVKAGENQNELESEDLDTFQDELDEYDLLGSGVNKSAKVIPDTDLSSTARAFNTRIKERKKAQEIAQDEAEKAAYQRHASMLKALVSIRKSLRDVTKIDLGERFEFALLADDWQGWPRLSIRLNDKDLPEEEYPQLSVTAHDRQAKGMIELVYDANAEPARISLLKEQDLVRLPKILRKCVRSYLDGIADIILEAENQQDQDATDELLGKKDNAAFEEEKKPAQQAHIAADLFDEEFHGDNLFDSLPSVDSVGSLPASLDFDLDE